MSDMKTASLVLSSFVVLVMGLLAWRERTDRRSRSEELTPEDAQHFRSQDRRRTFGFFVLGLLAVGIVVGSRLPYKVDQRASRLFLAVWAVVFFLLFILLTLAMVDWFALRIFARRLRTRMNQERSAILRSSKTALEDHGPYRNGQGNGKLPPSDLFP